MGRKERERLVLSRVKRKELTRAEGAQILGLSLRQMHRIYVRWLQEKAWCSFGQTQRGLRRVEIWERFDGTVTVVSGGRRLNWQG